jgi:hypothetical protein
VVSLEALLQLLDKTPVVAELPPVTQCYLPSDVTVYQEAAELAWKLDRPSETLPERSVALSVDSPYNKRFPLVRVDHDPFTPAMNSIIFDRFDDVAASMLTQSDLAETIITIPDAPDIICLMLIDGMSYVDARNWLERNPRQSTELLPCLVDAPTLTEIAFPRIIGDTPLAVQLFDRGYRNRLGFTYWTRERNALTNRLFRTISRVEAVGDLSAILSTLRAEIDPTQMEKTFVQIVRTGLDGYAHHQKRRPPIKAIVDGIFGEVAAMAGLIRELGCSGRIHLVSDHGILWRDEFEPQIVGQTQAGANPRVCRWKDLYQQSESGRRFVIDGVELYCLGFPKLRRPLRIDEQGVHGGISFEESIVPFLTLRIG